jgi:hypothetical protein
LDAETGQFIPVSNFVDGQQQIVAPPGFTFVPANVIPAQSSRNTMQYLNMQQHIQQHEIDYAAQQQYYHQTNRQYPPQQRHHNFQSWNSSYITDLENNREMMQISEIGPPEAVVSKACRFISLGKHEKEYLKGKLVQNVYLSLQGLFRNVGCLVGEAEGNGYVTKIKVYKFKNLHYAPAMFELATEHIKIKELSMATDMKKGRFYRYGIEMKIVVDKSEVDALTEVLQLLNLRPVFVKGDAFEEPSDLGLGLSIMSLEKNRSRPIEYDYEDLEPQDSNTSETDSSKEKKNNARPVLKAFTRLSIDIDGKPMHLDIQKGSDDTTQITEESLEKLRKSISQSQSVCNDRGFKSVSMDRLVSFSSNSTPSKLSFSSRSSRSDRNSQLDQSSKSETVS